jgi:hypothetical protein
VITFNYRNGSTRLQDTFQRLQRRDRLSQMLEDEADKNVIE